REAEALQNVCFRLARRTDQEKAVGTLDAAALGFADSVFDLSQGLPFVEAVEDFLRPRFDSEGQKVAVCLPHDRELVHCYRIHAPLAAPLELELSLDDPLANIINPAAFEQEMVIGEVDGAIAHVVELLHLP